MDTDDNSLSQNDVHNAEKIILDIYNDNQRWLQEPKVKPLIEGIKRIFDRRTPTFIFELIQNAYDANAQKVSITLTDKEMVFLHDGKPFDAKDCEAISWANITTKGRDKVGYMGIGFKTVFEISNTPSINSPPYHFYYDIIKNENGEYLPMPLSPEPIDPQYTTKITLPLKNEKIHQMICNELLSDSENKFDGLAPKSFLHLISNTDGELKGITNVSINGEHFEIRKNPKISGVYNISKLTDNEWKLFEKWLKFEVLFTPTEKEILSYWEGKQIPEARRLEGGWQEKVSIIIPLLYGGKKKDLFIEYKGNINAYLPTMLKTRNPFDLQANFIVSADRTKLNDVDGDWNRALFKKLPELIADVLKWGKQYSEKFSLAGPTLFHIIPDWNAFPIVSDSLKKEMAELFYMAIADEAIIPLKSKKKKYAKPSEVMLVRYKILNLFPHNQYLENILGKYVAEPELLCVGEILEKYLMVSRWKVEDIYKILNNPDWQQHIPKFSTMLAANKWLASLHHCLKLTLPIEQWVKTERNEILSKIRKYPLFPTTWDQATNSYILKPSVEGIIKMYSWPKDMVSIPSQPFENKIYILNSSYSNYISGRTIPKDQTDWEVKDRSEASQLMGKNGLGIGDLDNSAIIRDFLFPAIKNPEKLDRPTLLQYSGIIAKFIDNVNVKDIPKNFKIINNNDEFAHSSKLYLNGKLNRPDLEILFGSTDQDIYISDEYLSNLNVLPEQWAKFFVAIGVNDKLAIDISEKQYWRHTLEKVMDVKDLENPRASDHEGIPGNTYLVVNPKFDETTLERIAYLGTLPKIKRDESIRAFWRIIDSNWADYYSKYTRIRGRFVKYASNRVLNIEDQIDTPVTDFGNFLRKTPLIIAENSDELRFPKDVLKLNENTGLLIEKGVPVCSLVLANEDLIDWLDFNETINDVSPIEHLRLLKSKGRLTSSIFKDKAIEISKWIELKKLNSKEVRNAFELDKLIVDDNAEFWKLSDVFYESPFSVYYPNYKELYPSLKDFFCQDLGCPEKEPRIDQFLNLFLDYLWPKKGQYSLNDNVRSDIVKCYRRMNNYLEEHGQNDLPDTFKKYQEQCLVYCLKESDWISSNDNAIVYCDIPLYRDNFITQGISLASHIEHLKKDVNAIAPLLEFLNVIPASKLESRVAVVEPKPYSVTFEAHTESLIIENLTYYCQAIELILSHFEKEESSNAVKQTLSETIARIRQFSSMKKSLRVSTRINLDLFTTNGTKLISDKKDVHFQVKNGYLDIYLTGELVMVYGPLANELIAHLGFTELPTPIEKALKSLTRDTTALLSGSKYKEAVGRYTLQYTGEDGVSEEEEENLEGDDDDEIEVTIGTPEGGDGAGSDEEETDEETKYDDISKPVDLDQVTVEEPNIDEATPPPSKEPQKKGHKRKHRGGHIDTTWSDEDGQKGEKIVYDKEVEKVTALATKMNLDPKDYPVVWISRIKPENPWDIESWMPNKDGNALVRIRVEVKSSSGSGYTFLMSQGEFKTALSPEHKKGRYYVYRVFNVREPNPSIKIFDFEQYYSRKLISFEGKDFYITLPHI